MTIKTQYAETDFKNATANMFAIPNSMGRDDR